MTIRWNTNNGTFLRNCILSSLNCKTIILRFHFQTPPESVDYLIALLAGLPFTAFEEVHEGILTAMPESDWTAETLQQIESLKEQVFFLYSFDREEEKNWNEIWESEFREVIINNFCIIRAPFHEATTDFLYDIVIEPRMAFGTGHHETTRLMIRSMQILNLVGQKVLDFGTGSGILAILAAKMGATQVCAIENDEQAFVNLQENILYNDGQSIEAWCKGDLTDFRSGFYKLVLANITRNVLIEHAYDLVRILEKDGFMVVSGFLAKDHAIIIDTFLGQGLSDVSFMEENDWIVQTFQK